jgi:hypothetical protein
MTDQPLSLNPTDAELNDLPGTPFRSNAAERRAGFEGGVLAERARIAGVIRSSAAEALVAEARKQEADWNSQYRSAPYPSYLLLTLALADELVRVSSVPDGTEELGRLLPEQFARLRTLAEQAAPAPWTSVDVNEGTGALPFWEVVNEAYSGLEGESDEVVQIEVSIGNWSDAEFIAEARNTVPALIEENLRLRNLLNQKEASDG